MRATRLHLPTLREPPKDAELVSHQYLVRGGYIRRVAAGIYSFLPLGVRVVEKVKAIIRDEMNRAGALEVFMPAIVPAELWQESKRWEQYGPELLRLKDRKQAEYCVGPTHEEVVVDLVRKDVKSYKQLPINLYQIQTKFRDEMRPRAGLMRGREFVMKDAYSFDASVEGAHLTYRGMYDAYQRIFTRMGLDFRAVEADTGNIGGSMSHEFQVLAETGEDAIVSCDTCNFAANVEKAPLREPEPAQPSAAGAWQVVDTPGAKSIESVCKMLGCKPDQMIKAVLYMADDQPAVAFVRGDREVNEIKVKQALGVAQLHLADAEWFAKATGLPPGYLGPLELGTQVKVVLDQEILAMDSAVAGANEKQKHITGIVPTRDLCGLPVADVRMAVQGDPCPRCLGLLRAFRGIEVGHVFYLGQKYSKAMDATFVAESGELKAFEMGCYGIGVTRILAATIEQNHDQRGIFWPVPLAPFEVAVIDLQPDGKLAEELYEQLRLEHVDVLWDDRDERAGVKFNDADLIGYPLQITVGKKAAARIVEVKNRQTGERFEIHADGLAAHVARSIRAARDGSRIQFAQA